MVKSNKKHNILNNLYSKFKTNNIIHILDHIKSIKQTKSLTYFRISAHNLHIERRRHNVNKIHRNQRTYMLCIQ